MSTPTLDTLDTAAAATPAGAPTQVGADLPRDLLTNATPEPSVLPGDPLGPDTTADQPVIGAPAAPSSLDQYNLDQAKKAADQQTANLAGTPQTTAGLPTPEGNSIGAKIVRAAEAYIGTPYKWGGSGPGGVDCSGLVMLAYQAAGINLPRVSYQQANMGFRVGLRALRPGDLVAWDNSTRNPGADHIAVYIGFGKIVEAPYPGAKVRVRLLGKNEGAWGVRMSW